MHSLFLLMFQCKISLMHSLFHLKYIDNGIFIIKKRAIIAVPAHNIAYVICQIWHIIWHCIGGGFLHPMLNFNISTVIWHSIEDALTFYYLFVPNLTLALVYTSEIVI